MCGVRRIVVHMYIQLYLMMQHTIMHIEGQTIIYQLRWTVPAQTQHIRTAVIGRRLQIVAIEMK